MAGESSGQASQITGSWVIQAGRAMVRSLAAEERANAGKMSNRDTVERCGRGPHGGGGSPGLRQG